MSYGARERVGPERGICAVESVFTECALLLAMYAARVALTIHLQRKFWRAGIEVC